MPNRLGYRDLHDQEQTKTARPAVKLLETQNVKSFGDAAGDFCTHQGNRTLLPIARLYQWSYRCPGREQADATLPFELRRKHILVRLSHAQRHAHHDFEMLDKKQGTHRSPKSELSCLRTGRRRLAPFSLIACLHKGSNESLEQGGLLHGNQLIVVTGFAGCIRCPHNSSCTHFRPAGLSCQKDPGMIRGLGAGSTFFDNTSSSEPQMCRSSD